MPRRHPKEDDRKPGPSPAVLAERRRRREERRARKSPGEDRTGLLTFTERRILLDLLADCRRGDQSDPQVKGQIGSLKRELDLDREVRAGL